MSKEKLSAEEKLSDLKKFRDLVLAAIDYYLENPSNKIETHDFESNEYFESLKNQTLEHYSKGRLTKLKQWFRDLTEMEIEARNLGYNKYLQNKTGYDINIFEDYFKRVEKIIGKEKITTDNQFYDISIMVDQLCSEESMDRGRIEILTKLLSAYEARKSKRRLM